MNLPLGYRYSTTYAGIRKDPAHDDLALIVSAVQHSIKLRGAGPTKASLRYEEANISGEVDFDFVRSR